MSYRSCPAYEGQGGGANPAKQQQQPAPQYIPCPTWANPAKLQPQPAPQYIPCPTRANPAKLQPQPAPQYIPCPTRNNSAKQRPPLPPQYIPCPVLSNSARQPQPPPPPPQYIACRKEQPEVMEPPPPKGFEVNPIGDNEVQFVFPDPPPPPRSNSQTRGATSNASMSQSSTSRNQSQNKRMSKVPTFEVNDDDVSVFVPNPKGEESSQPEDVICLCDNGDVASEEEEEDLEPDVKITMEVSDDPNDPNIPCVSISRTPQSIRIRVASREKLIS